MIFFYPEFSTLVNRVIHIWLNPINIKLKEVPYELNTMETQRT